MKKTFNSIVPLKCLAWIILQVISQKGKGKVPVPTMQKLEPAELKLLYTKGSIFADHLPMAFVLNVI
jgi:hypothetical protein